MGFNTFSTLVGIRTAVIMLTLLAITALIFTPGYHAAIVALFLFLSFQCFSLVKFVGRTNAELVRFLDAARFADYSQRFDLKGQGSGFSELAEAFEDILTRFHSNRQEQEQKLKHLKAVVEHLPVPLVSIKANGKLTLWNNAARRLFASNHIVNVSDLKAYGDEFAKQLTSIKAGEQRLVSLEIDNMSYQLSVSMTEIIIGQEHEKLLSLQDIRNELDANQLKAWQDLVKVLTHEIMNSITPVASLAETAADLVDDTKQKLSAMPEAQNDLDNIGRAVGTVARRSNGLMDFVSSYRKLTSLPPLNRQELVLANTLQQVIDITSQDQEHNHADITMSIEPLDLKLNADPSMLEQMLINLVKNARQASQSHPSPCVKIHAGINKRSRVVIEIDDNGDGIAEDIQEQIFVPFFTTKKEGSGVGLALTRQVMNAHKGTIKVGTSDLGGARFTLVF